MAAFQLPSILRISGLGPGVSLGFGFCRFVATLFALRCDWRSVHKALSFGSLDRSLDAFAVVQLAIVPNEVELPDVAMQILPTNVMVDTHDSAFDERERAFRRIRVDVAANVFASVINLMMAAFEFLVDAVVGREFIRNDARSIVPLLARIASLSVSAVTSAITRRRILPPLSTAANTGVFLVHASRLVEFFVTWTGLSANVGFVAFDRSV